MTKANSEPSTNTPIRSFIWEGALIAFVIVTSGAAGYLLGGLQ